MRVVAIGEALLGHRHRAAGAFGDVLPRHLGVDAARDRALGAMHREEAAYLGQDPVERPRLVAVGRLDAVAVHRVAAPPHRMPLAPPPADEPWPPRPYLDTGRAACR